MNRTGILAVTLGVVSVWVVLAAGVAAVWLTEEVRVFGLVMAPSAIVASLTVLYFEWRARWRHRVRTEHDTPADFDKAA